MASVLAQTYGDFELVVVDDCSTDGTREYLATLVDPRVRVVTTSANLGPGRTYDRCLAEARGRWVKIVCDDDLLAPDCLERQVAVLTDPANSGVTLVAGRRWVIDAGGTRLMRRGSRLRGRVRGRDAIRAAVRSGTNPFGEPSAVLFAADAARRAGGFGESVHYAMDLGLWLRLLLAGDLYMLPDSVSSFRISGGSWSVTHREFQSRQFAEFLRMLGGDPQLEVSPADIRAGTRAASRQAALRGALYRLIGVRPSRERTPARRSADVQDSPP